MTIDVNIQDLQQWIGRSEELQDIITPVPIRALASTLDLEDSASLLNLALKPCWHWLYFLPLHRHSHIGKDGHPTRGGFLPPVPFPRRMWAGSQVTFESPLQVGEAITRVSSIADVKLREGRTGPLVFVQVKHTIWSDGKVCVRETQDIVYRSPSSQAARPNPEQAQPIAESAPEEFDWSREITPDEVLLFRYSALTFNGHRIHYDRPYATSVEGYPGLVVHGPLVATLLMDLFARQMPRAQVTAFSFKAKRPLFDTVPFLLRGCRKGSRTADLWAVTPRGETAVAAQVQFI